jgi:hypothetical protein
MIKIRNLHLFTTALVVIAAAGFYGIYPDKTLPLLFDFRVQSTDLNHVFRAIMGAYLAFAAYWIVGIAQPQHWRNATLLNVLFMGGLAFGRLVSIVVDGIPSAAFCLAPLLELFCMIWGIVNLNRNLNTLSNV